MRILILVRCQHYTEKPFDHHIRNPYTWKDGLYIDGLMQERRNSIANALELRLPCIDPALMQERRNSIANAPELRLSCINPSI